MSIPAEPPPGAARLALFTPVREYPPLADRKASALLAANGLMVSVLLTFSKAIAAILTGSNHPASYLLLAILVPLTFLILVGAWYAFHALTRAIPPMPDSLAFYPHVAAHSLDAYRDRVKGLDYQRAVAAMLHYNYSLATLSVEKFRLVDRSIAAARSTFELWMVLLLMIVLFQ
jgi:hypothetical protein